MKNKTNIEEDTKILKEKLDMLNKHISNYKKTNCKTAVHTELVKEAIAINHYKEREQNLIKYLEEENIQSKVHILK